MFSALISGLIFDNSSNEIVLISSLKISEPGPSGLYLFKVKADNKKQYFRVIKN